MPWNKENGDTHVFRNDNIDEQYLQNKKNNGKVVEKNVASFIFFTQNIFFTFCV